MPCCPQCGYNSDDGHPCEITFIYATREVAYQGHTTRLSPKQMDILDHLLDSGTRGLTTAQIYQLLYSHLPECQQPSSDRGVVSVQIHHLRRKLSKIGVLVQSTGRGITDNRYSLSVYRRPRVNLEAAE